eukprot:1801031-Rhodomonas_salina.2
MRARVVSRVGCDVQLTLDLGCSRAQPVKLTQFDSVDSPGSVVTDTMRAQASRLWTTTSAVPNLKVQAV